jgi:hypothetical protein
LTLLVNGTPAQGDTAMVPVGGLQTFTFTIPANVIGDGKHITLTLNYDAPDVPANLGASTDQRPLAIAVDWIRFKQLQSP